jgi:hypothetical protein
MPVAALGSGGSPASVIGDEQPKTALVERHFELDPGAGGMAQNVGQALLEDAGGGGLFTIDVAYRLRSTVC